MNKYDYGACWESNADDWTRLTRAGYDVYRDALHTPAFLRILPDVSGRRGLDVGCGEGAGTRHLARLGANMVGADISPTFIRYAVEEETREPLGIRYQQADAANLPFPDASFDFASAFMSLMDVDDLPGVIREIARVLTPGGFLQFSILHPCFSPPRRRVLRDDSGKVLGVELGGYFDRSERMETWTFSSLPEAERQNTRPFITPYRHYPLSDWFAILSDSGLTVEHMEEPQATEELAAKIPMLDDTLEFPLAMILRVGKRG